MANRQPQEHDDRIRAFATCILPPLEKAATILVNLAPLRRFSQYERLIVERAAEGNYIVACLPLFTYVSCLATLLRNVTDQERALTCLGGLAEEGIGRWEVDPEPFA